MADFTTVTGALQQYAKLVPQRPAFIFHDCHGGRQVLTYELIYRLGGRWAAVLKASGLGRGHFILNTLPNSPERAVCETGLLMSGAFSVNGQCQLADGSDILHGLQKSQAMAIVIDPDFHNIPWNALRTCLQLIGQNDVACEKLPSLRKVFFIRRNEKGSDDDFLSHLENLDDWFYDDEITADDICTVFTTSGSTGFSKLVVKTHGDIVRTAKKMETVNYVSPESLKRFSIALFGWVGGYLGYTFVAADTRVLFDFRTGIPDDMAELIYRTIQEEKCDTGFVAPIYMHKSPLTSDGFIRTGDIGKLTADGHLIVEGRGSDAISRGVYIFYPGWLETRIRRCPGVVDVAVVGVPDPGVGEELCACLLLESDDITVQSLQEFVEKDIVTSINDPLSPRPRFYLKFDSFPLTRTDKTFRRFIRDEATVRLSKQG
ncbi:uncharacterized protein LOC112561258 [Pomacea canaliculata]|uniref:uncharacterized protein LOC112561258 n=1 Tax=Pomacea canaliculata TaxID=400727 RepID=UPI000D738A2E|nr:uncharacterized protein LOC112561258 [Pomacea canaliculata]